MDLTVVVMSMDAAKCFELFGENNVREIWVPGVKSNV